MYIFIYHYLHIYNSIQNIDQHNGQKENQSAEQWKIIYKQG
jgi:hypothetical protein